MTKHETHRCVQNVAVFCCLIVCPRCGVCVRGTSASAFLDTIHFYASSNWISISETLALSLFCHRGEERESTKHLLSVGFVLRFVICDFFDRWDFQTFEISKFEKNRYYFYLEKFQEISSIFTSYLPPTMPVTGRSLTMMMMISFLSSSSFP